MSASAPTRSAPVPAVDPATMLVDVDWLRARLGDPSVAVIESTVSVSAAAAQADGGPAHRSAREAWEASHIPGSRFVDLTTEASDPTSGLPFTVPPATRLEATLRGHGVRRDQTIVVYDRDHNIWAARLWMLIRSHGHANVVVLDGGWRAWTLAGGPVTDEIPPVAAGDFVATPQPGWWASRDDVLAAMRDDATCLLSAQTSVQYEGLTSGNASPGGRIPGSVNVHARTLTDPETQRFLDRTALAERLGAAGALGAPRVIAYCGAGIAAAGDAFALRLCGARDVRVFDGGMSEWAADGRLPVERGPVPGLEHTAASRGADG